MGTGIIGRIDIGAGRLDVSKRTIALALSLTPSISRSITLWSGGCDFRRSGSRGAPVIHPTFFLPRQPALPILPDAVGALRISADIAEQAQPEERELGPFICSRERVF